MLYVEKTSWTSSERRMYVQFISCIQGATVKSSLKFEQRKLLTPSVHHTSHVRLSFGSSTFDDENIGAIPFMKGHCEAFTKTALALLMNYFLKVMLHLFNLFTLRGWPTLIFRKSIKKLCNANTFPAT